MSLRGGGELVHKKNKRRSDVVTRAMLLLVVVPGSNDSVEFSVSPLILSCLHPVCLHQVHAPSGSAAQEPGSPACAESQGGDGVSY